MEVTTLSLTRDASFPVTIAGVNCNALINTGAMHSCTSEIFYNQLMLPWLLKAFNSFPVTIAGVNCNALINTGAMHNCISELFYNQLMLPWLLKAFHLLVPSTSGNTLSSMGIIQCLVKLGEHSLDFNFIVCRNLMRHIILGMDFKQKHQIGSRWSDTGKG